MAEDELLGLRLENGRLREVQQKLLAENESLTEELSGLIATVRTQAKREQALKRKLESEAEKSPDAQDIKTILHNWARLTGRKVKFDEDGRQVGGPVVGPASKRWKVARLALRHHSLEECLEAVEGIALLPYVGSQGRMAEGKHSQRYDDVEYALKDEVTIEKARRYRARVKGASTEQLMEAWRAAEATAHLYLSFLQERW